MNLWIRSQDRTTLMKVDRLDIDYSSGLYLIKSDGFGTLLANYKSEERALEVLDEIQGLFIKKDTVKSELNKDGLTMVTTPITHIVYEMPKEL